MDIEKEKKRTKKWFVSYTIITIIMIIAIGIHWLFLLPTIVFIYIVFLICKDLRKLDEIQEVAKDNLEDKKINKEENKMELSREERAEMLETLSRDEDVIFFMRVTKGQVKYGLLERLRKSLETKPEKKPEPVAEKPKEEPAEDDDIVVED